MARTGDKKLRSFMLRTSMIKPPDIASVPICDAHKQQQLVESIRLNGMIQPLLVTREPLELWYTLVAGRRRFAAAKQLGLDTVPAVVIAPENAVFAAMFENLYREPPSCFETAVMLSKLVEKLRVNNPAQLREQIGMPEPEIQEKLKLLALGDERIELCKMAGITQETANRILSMPKSERDKLFFGLQNPSRDIEERAWQLRDRLGLDATDAPRRAMVVKDVRIFFNTIEKAIDLMKQAGVEAISERNDYDGLIEYVIKIPCKVESNPHISVV